MRQLATFGRFSRTETCITWHVGKPMFYYWLRNEVHADSMSVKIWRYFGSTVDGQKHTLYASRAFAILDVEVT